MYIQCIWQVFLFKAYCNFKVELAAIHPCRHTTSFKRLTTSYDVLPTLKERLVSMEIWVAPLLFQEPTWQWSNIFKVLPLFEISTWNRLCFQIYWFDSPPVAAIHSSNGLFYYKRVVVATHSFKFTVFFQTRRLVVRRYHSYQLWYLLSFRYV